MGVPQCQLHGRGLQGVGGVAAGRGNKAAAKGRGRSALKHRGKGIKVIDLQTDLPCKNHPEAIVGEVVIGTAQEDLCLSKAANKAASLRMHGDSADKLAVDEDDTTSTPVPERVRLISSFCVYFHFVD